MTEVSKDCQQILVYKINPNQQELEGEVNFDRNADGRTFYGRIFIVDNVVFIKDEKEVVTGIFSLDHYYFLNP